MHMQFKRYAYLDGLRGIAALFVLTRHTEDFWGFSFFRSYLAVDLFFLLSGFVIAYAYSKKLSTGLISVKDFVLIRLIRLYPVFFLSFALCVVIMIAKLILKPNPNDTFDSLLLTVSLTAFILPSGFSADDLLFPMNGPYWSLFFELIINFIYALFRPLLSPPVLVAVVCFFGSVLLTSALYHGSLDIGFTWSLSSAIAGFSRAAFGIFFGILMYQQGHLLPKLPKSPFFPLMAIILTGGVLMSPSAGGANPWIDLLSVTLIFPLCVIIASHAEKTKLDGLLLTLGSASYPIYVFHYPLGHAVAFVSKGLEATLAPYGGIAFVLCLIPIAIWIEKIYDIPLRQWLTTRFLRSTPRQQSHRDSFALQKTSA